MDSRRLLKIVSRRRFSKVFSLDSDFMGYLLLILLITLPFWLSIFFHFVG